MFLDILKLRVENKTKTFLEETVLIMWSHFFVKIALIVRKVTLKNIISNMRTSRGYILAVMQFVTQFTPGSRHPRS